MRRLHKTLKLMTYNIHNGVGRDGRYRLDRVLNVIESQAPDIVALQEVDNGVGRSDYDDQTQYLACALNMNCLHCVTRATGHGTYGISVLSKHPIIHSQRYDITHHSSREPRACLRVDLQVGSGAVLHVFNCHLGLTALERHYQQRAMLSEAILLSRDLEHPVVLMGDFNDRPLPVVHNRLRLYFKDAYLSTGKRYGPTFRLGPLRFCLDHIYTSPEVHVDDCWVVRDGLTHVASDHRPLLAVIGVEWRPQRTADMKIHANAPEAELRWGMH